MKKEKIKSEKETNLEARAQLFKALGLGGSNAVRRLHRHEQLVERVMKKGGWESERLRKPKAYFDAPALTDNRHRVFVRPDAAGNPSSTWWHWNNVDELVKS